MSILLAFSYVDYSDSRRMKAQEEAIKTFSKVSKSVIPVAFGFRGENPNTLIESLGIQSLNILRRDSSIEIENDRRLPYISEIFNYCSKIKCDVFGYVNSDILISPDVIDILINESYDAYMFSRYEIVEMDSDSFLNGFSFGHEDYKIQKVWGGDKHEGRDAFFFNREWWIENGGLFPSDVVISETEWDTIYRFMIKYGDKFFKNAPTYIDERMLYHPLHNSSWNNKSNGALNNIKIWNKVRERIGEIK